MANAIGQVTGGAGSLIGLGATQGMGAKNPFGSSKKTNAFLANTVKDINAGGLRIGYNSGSQSFFAQPDANRVNLVNALSGVYGKQAGELAGIQEQVRPGFGRLTEAVVQSLANARQRAVSTVSDELSRRRMLGSSFGADTLARTEREFADTEAQYRAQATLQEIAMTMDVLREKSAALAQEQAVKLSELNLQADLAFKLGTGMNAGLMEASTGFEKLLAAQAMDTRAAYAGGIGQLTTGLGKLGIAALMG